MNQNSGGPGEIRYFVLDASIHVLFSKAPSATMVSFAFRPKPDGTAEKPQQSK